MGQRIAQTARAPEREDGFALSQLLVARERKRGKLHAVDFQHGKIDFRRNANDAGRHDRCPAR